MLHYEAVRPDTLGLLKKLMAFNALDSFVLVGGTSLALQFGHRISEDIDMFSVAEFNEDILLNMIQEKFPNTNVGGTGIRTLNLMLDEVKVDLLRYNYPLLEEIIVEDGIRMMGKRDISAMKLSAISSRGAKKDYYDLYFLLQHYSIGEMLEFYQTKFNIQNIFHVVKSIDYFDDAEKSKDVEEIISVSWKEVKAYISKAKLEYEKLRFQ